MRAGGLASTTFHGCSTAVPRVKDSPRRSTTVEPTLVEQPWNSSGTAVEHTVLSPALWATGIEPVTLAKVLKSVPRAGFEPMTTSKFFLHDPDSNLGKTQKVVRPGFELVASRKACCMADHAPGLPYWVDHTTKLGCGTAVEQVVDEGRGSALFHGCSTAVPRESTLQSWNIVDCPDSWNSRGTSWTGTPQL